MKRFDEVQTASATSTPAEDEGLKEDLIQRLESEGHKVVRVGRALVVVEQCEAHDAFPGRWSTEPIRLTVYGDPDLGERRDELFVHAARYGLMSVFRASEGRKTDELIGLPANDVEDVRSSSPLTRARAIRTLLEPLSHGAVEVGATVSANGVDVPAARTVHDETAKRLGEELMKALDHLIRHLDSRADLFRGFPRQ